MKLKTYKDGPLYIHHIITHKNKNIFFTAYKDGFNGISWISKYHNEVGLMEINVDNLRQLIKDILDGERFMEVWNEINRRASN